MAAYQGRGRGRRPGTVAGALFVLACLVVLTLTFMLGMLVGRQWARHTARAAPVAANAEDKLGPFAAARGGRADSPGARPLDVGRSDSAGARPLDIGRGDSPGPRPPDIGRADSPGARPLGTGRDDSRGGRPLDPRRGDSSGAARPMDPGRGDSAGAIQEKLTFYKTLTAPLTAAPPVASRRPAPGAATAGTEGESWREPTAGHAVLPGALYTVQVAAFRSRDQADRLREQLGHDAYVSEAGSAPSAKFRVRMGSFAARAEAETAAARLRAERSLSGFVTRK